MGLGCSNGLSHLRCLVRWAGISSSSDSVGIARLPCSIGCRQQQRGENSIGAGTSVGNHPVCEAAQYVDALVDYGNNSFEGLTGRYSIERFLQFVSQAQNVCSHADQCGRNHFATESWLIKPGGGKCVQHHLPIRDLKPIFQVVYPTLLITVR
jgi:hypothetical protein